MPSQQSITEPLVKFNTFRSSFELSEFVPETYKLDLRSEREAFYAAFKGVNIVILMLGKCVDIDLLFRW
jgi:hypothetical protein